MKNGKRIHRVTIKRMVDESPDTSWLGEYSDRKTSEYSLDRAHDEDCPSFDNEDGEVCNCEGSYKYWDRRSYRYFNPSLNYVDKNGHALKGNTPEDVRKYVRQDYERMERLNRGDWCFMVIRVDAELNIPGGNLAFIAQDITSGGLWGIESDSDAGYIKSVEDEQLANLAGQLHELGFSKRAIAAAFKNVEREGE